MAAGDTEFREHNPLSKMRSESWRLTTNGVAPVTVKSHLGQIRLVQGSVLGDVGAEGATLECTISSDKTSVSVTMSRDVVVDVDLILAGY